MDDRVKEIYALRRNGELDEALKIAIPLCNQDPDDDNFKALGWVLIDLCKISIANNNLNKAQNYYNTLSKLQFDYEDEFVETLKKQINYLRPRIDIYYSQIQQIEELSKTGQEKLALEKIRIMISNNQLSEVNHETYGWIVYRYMKSVEADANSVEIRTLLRDYMNLKNERPSMLHSMILNFALNYSKNHSDFKFYNFFVLWNSTNLRYDDLHDGYKDGKNIPSLISRICREFVNNNSIIDIENDLIAKVNINRESLIDFFREPYFWLLFNAHRENRITELWSLFTQYNTQYSKYGKSKWHSEILKLADRFMKEADSWRFLIFFKDWNPAFFMDADWKEEKGKEGEIYKPLAIKALKKSFEVIKDNKVDAKIDYSWLIDTYTSAVSLFPSDEWLIREKALLHIKQKELDLATTIYKKLVLDLGNKYYVWQEFAECFDNDNELKIGMLSKAISLETNEDFLGEIHLKLAETLIAENYLENALLELTTFKNHRLQKGWRLPESFDTLYKKVSHIDLKIKDNKQLFPRYIQTAENFVYQDIEWIDVVLTDRWISDDKKERVNFTNGVDLDFTTGINKFPCLKRVQTGETFKVKFHKQEIQKEIDNPNSWPPKKIITEHKIIPLLIERTEKENWSILPLKYGYIEYVNKDKKTLHVITNDSNPIFYQFDQDVFMKGSYIVFRQYSKKIKDENRYFIEDIKNCENEIAINQFKSRIVVVNDINESKRLFHYVLGKKLLSGIAFFDDTDIRPAVGDFLKVYFCVKKDKEGKKKLVTLKVEQTEEQNLDIRKTINGRLELKYKYDWNDNGDGENADFAFIGDYYVPKSVLSRFNITKDCNVTATAVYTGDGDKWKVFDIIPNH